MVLSEFAQQICIEEYKEKPLQINI